MALLTPQGVKEIFQLEKPEGREHLRRLLQWEAPREQEEARADILLDLLYDSIIFAVGKGFPWTQVPMVVRFTEELLRETRGHPITEALTLLGKKLQDYQGQFGTSHLLALCDYAHNTYIRHYNLYQYVLSQAQDVNLSVEQVEVCAPPQPLALAQGTELAMWQHEQRLAELALAELQKRADVLVQQEMLKLEKEQLLRKIFSGELAQHPGQRLCSEDLKTLVSEAIHVQVEHLKQLLEQEIQVTFEILDLRLQKKILSLNEPVPSLLLIPSQHSPDLPLKLSRAPKRGKQNKGKK
ncbi:uncharacterized protein C8orf74 homolog [Sorex araneus]|uniref:uncharacterized protein C8orf74 homolog n=1 Tax=Sorex araneus TaxID=42254 RepID=UPI0003319044|nr:uncharacterized protein C8orf74 homolog [Sorex araneus]